MGTPKKKSMPATARTKATIRRRRGSAGRVSKISFSLQADVVNAIKRAVREGRAESASAFVEQAIREQLQWTRRQVLYQSYAEAARNPAFSDDVIDTALREEIEDRLLEHLDIAFE
jgi:Arc/MetJ-type ribon-helix-helix transcriptional regulator